mgnify:CR=1 FL=1
MGARELSLEAARGDGVAVLQLTQGAQASGAQDLDTTRVVLAADAVDGHAPVSYTHLTLPTTPYV